MPTRHSVLAPEGARRLVLVRHGRTAWNHTRRAQGHADIELDEVGRREGAAMARVVARLRPAGLWSSDLARAALTAAYLAAASGIEVQLDPRLREYSVGERSGLTRAEFAERFPAEYAAWEADDETLLVPGAETTADVLARMVPALRECLEALEPGQVGVVVTHGACLRAAMLELVGLPQSADGVFATMGNCTWTVLQQSETGGPVRIASYAEGVQGHGFASEDEVG
ncbi:MAG TPA: histidine phosphatase family protein [Dermatophilaceae bacterium]|nr:histidine phosphatase family protein [Dermatophilaceae bacterium]